MSRGTACRAPTARIKRVTFMRRIIHFVVTLCIALLITACAHKPEDQRLTEQQYYETAQRAMRNDNYTLAVEQLEQLESRFPFGSYSDQVALDLIYAQYKNLDVNASAEQADKFIRLHPDHQNVDYAYYMQGLAHSTLGRDVFSRLLPSEPSERDLASVKQAFADFNRLVERFPNSRYAGDARQRMIYLRNLLAEHELYIARYYFDRRAYVAAANRANYIIEHYQATPVIPDALAMAVRSYRAMNMKELADAMEKTLASNFPRYEGFNQQGQLVFKKTASNDEKSLLNIMTFGLADRTK